MKRTLLVLAAGLGSRYGGLKQLETFGPNGELLMDYSIYDAINAGFNKIVFVIHENFAEEFCKKMRDKIDHSIELEFVVQDINDLPIHSNKKIERFKPWGTAHAVWVARKVINEPFLVINADDYYGKNAYKVAYNFLAQYNGDYSVLGYRLGSTLSNYGGVNRGICFTENNPEFLTKITEFKGIRKESYTHLIYLEPTGDDIILSENDIVSMNMFCLRPSFFELTEKILIDFLNNYENRPGSEILIPQVVDYAIKNNIIKTRILNSNSNWFGVTYKQDRIMATYKIQDQIKLGLYPNRLYNNSNENSFKSKSLKFEQELVHINE